MGHLDETTLHSNAYPPPSEGGFIGREEKMAGKNKCSMAGKGWREHMAGNEWWEDMAGRGWRETGGGTYGGKAFAGKY